MDGRSERGCEYSCREILTQEKSIYIQIKEMIERDILNGVLLEEEKVPSTNELAKLYAIKSGHGSKGNQSSGG